MKRLLAATAIAAASVLAPAPAAATPPGSDGAFTFRFGWFFPSGGGSFWETNEAAFTLDRSDFNGPIGGVGYSASVNNYFDVGFNVDFYGQSATSADRYYTDQFGNAILHDTRLSEAPLTVDFKVLPMGRYARRGPEGRQYVRHPVPYLGAGIGMVYWQYEEEGDFVATDLSIVYDRLTDSGVAFETHVLAGIEFPVSPAWNITLEGRYSWAETNMGGAFTTINPGELDLGGASVFVGGALRF
jgi:opacity protein-like surface antigen